MASTEASQPDPRSPFRRRAEVAAFVLLLIVIGELMDAGRNLARTEAYLLLTVPLTAAFQVLIRRRPIPDLWVRGAPPVARRRATWLIAGALAIYPAIAVVKALADGEAAWLVVGAVVTLGAAAAAGYAFGLFREATWRWLGLCLLFGLGWSLLVQAVFSLDEFFAGAVLVHPEQDVLIALTSFLTYVVKVFVIEEVTFRGAVDSHAHHDGDRHGVLVAIYVSVLWTLWHLPVYGWEGVALGLVLMVPLGVVLSIYWRRSGNLGVSGTTHAASDSVRNAILGGVP